MQIMALYRGLLSPTLGFGCCFAVALSAYGHGCRSIADYKKIHIDNLSLLDMVYRSLCPNNHL